MRLPVIGRWLALALGVVVGASMILAPATGAGAAVPYSGPGFDTCAAPSTSAMSAWLASPYRSIGIYIGGANRACGDGNLSASWVSTVEAMGWRLAPLYVGLQAPCVNQQGLATIDPTQAALEGTQAADDATARAQNFGLVAGTPIYFDMEAYASGCSGTVLAFVNAWSVELHAHSYLAGIYGSSSSAIADESSVYATPGQVDDIWFARWNGVPNIYNEPFASNAEWTARQRLHQFLNSQDQTFGGVTLNIDLDTADGGFAGTCGGMAPTCSTPIQAGYAQMGGTRSFLGASVGPELWLADGVGKSEPFAGGSFYWSPFTGAHEVHGSVRDTWTTYGGSSGFLGYPLSDALVTSGGGGRWQLFQGGSAFWSPATGAHEVHGAIRDDWASAGYENGFLGYPLSDALVTSGGGGRWQLFQGGSVFWSPGTGAHEVHGAIRDDWASAGYENGFLGYPLSDALVTADGVGRYQPFQGGAVFWSPATGAHEVHGAIRDDWASAGYERGFLGYPLSDALVTSSGGGRWQLFQGGSVFWSPATGAHEIHGAIRDKWASVGYENGLLGYPTTDAAAVGDGIGRFNQFQDGSIYWTPQGGAFEVHGAVWSAYLGIGGPTSSLGYPIGDPVATSYGARSTFQHGSIDWIAATGATVVNHT